MKNFARLIPPSICSLTVTFSTAPTVSPAPLQLLETVRVLRLPAAFLQDCTLININAGAKKWQKRVQGTALRW